MILVIDNYDSFTWNLVQYLGELGAEPYVRRNDDLEVSDVAALDPARIIISPGPGRPERSGISIAVIRELGAAVPILGVCLGHQAIGAAYGGRIRRAAEPVHGRTATVMHDGRGVFAGITGPFHAARYHSLVIDAELLPDVLEVAAHAREDGVIMAVRHRTHPVHGVQFHPESVLTDEGHSILRNFLEL